MTSLRVTLLLNVISFTADTTQSLPLTQSIVKQLEVQVSLSCSCNKLLIRIDGVSLPISKCHKFLYDKQTQV